MKSKILILFIFFFSLATAQTKRPLDHSVYNIWKSIAEPSISADGKWISYEQKNKDSYKKLIITNFQKTDTISNGFGLAFSPDSKFCIYRSKANFLRNLETSQTTLLGDSVICSFINAKDPLIQIMPKTKRSYKNLILYNPATNDSIVFKNVLKHSYSSNYKYILILQKEEKGNRLSLYDLPQKNIKTLETGSVDFSIAAFSNNTNSIAYMVANGEKDKLRYSIRVINTANCKLIDSVHNKSTGIPAGYIISGPEKLSFSNNGDKVFFKITKETARDTTQLKKNQVKVDIWKWDNPVIPPMIIDGAVSVKPSDFCQYHLKSRKVNTLSDDEMPFLQFPEGENETLTIGFSDVRYRKYVGIEPSVLYDSYLVNMTTGTKQLVLEKKYYYPSISIDKQWIAWYEPNDSSWYSMNTSTLTKKNLTSSINDIFYNEDLDVPMHSTHYGDAGWSSEGHNIIIHSKYDLWQIDASGEKAPVCITKNTGKKTGIEFRYIKPSKAERYINFNNNIYFEAFQDKTKKAGYYVLNKTDGLKELIFSDNTYDNFLLSKDGTSYIFRKGSFVDYPELYYSDSNFKTVKKISETNPQQKNYFWGTSEMVEWESFNKDTLQGILCKPENFDSTKKYPMLVYFYEKRSDNLNRYNVPAPMKSVVNWSYCVSNGYIVFIPDVVFRSGDPGESSYDAIVSGVTAMVDKYDFIDKDRIGINGHSWGGYQVAYLVTRTNMFKAALSGAAVVNMTSAYGGIRWDSGKSRMFQYEYGQSRIGGTLWDKPLAFINNSPLFFLPKVTTPILILHNDKDGSVPWEQGIEFFMALRRLEKQAWMLNYKNENHLLKEWNNRIDYTKKVMEFFDYYLKDEPRPGWM